MPEPFVKWVGGKRSLLSTLRKGMPNFRSYHEPMVGGGALFFKMASLNLFAKRKMFLSDSNEHLMRLWAEVRDNPEALLIAMRQHRRMYERDPERYYYRVRRLFNRRKNPPPSYTLFLNKTGFRGMYRVRADGGYNVPYGAYASPALVDYDAIRSASAVLRRVKLSTGDGAFDFVKKVKKGDLVYIDPPYYKTYRSYTTKAQQDHEFHKDLRDVCDKLKSLGAYVMISNSGEDYIHDLYEGWDIERVKGARKISVGENRDDADDVLIRNWDA